MNWIDLRSDTVTKPTDEMREAMKNAEVGDDVYEDDPTVNLLQEKSANVLGKEAALFVPSGTFGNQLSILTHTLRGDEVLIPEDNHIVVHEACASAVISGVQLSFTPAKNGCIDTHELSRRIRSEDLHYPRTGLICMENAHSSGVVVPLSNMEAVYRIAQKHSIPLHLDGARIFNAAVALRCAPERIAQYADSVMFCLSKGLCAPVGSIVAGTKEFIKKARKNRKIMGGALRQVGVLAAPGIIALDKMRHRLHLDHENAAVLASLLEKNIEIKVLKEQTDINMVFFFCDPSLLPSETLVTELNAKGIKINGSDDGVYRLVTHYWICREDVEYTAKAFSEILDRFV